MKEGKGAGLIFTREQTSGYFTFHHLPRGLKGDAGHPQRCHGGNVEKPAPKHLVLSDLAVPLLIALRQIFV